eukprot:CAMPEP_0203852806 /NCGR_PEP_ID=MMETSP0359-20131031/8149_1 /ASSEMBLY_ACC=CAM_ASM_000338 /TAXON_ID=268821 /ORGANISM="Scrippsiella Hangoei, Strain SHTV-5" /LENGTH=1009 /DNA_ID=CAMNT_0050769033 /DNA_START=39 /DNA_END=3068 /DNA_ORIENTATION=-
MASSAEDGSVSGAFRGMRLGPAQLTCVLKSLEEVWVAVTDEEVECFVSAAPVESDGKIDVDKFIEWIGREDEVVGEWTAQSWLQSLPVHILIAQALRVPANERPFEYVRSLDKTAVRDLLKAAKLEGLFKMLWKGLEELRMQEVSSATELNKKFKTEALYQAVYGSLSNFYGGLSGLIGGPRMIGGFLLESMKHEHCNGPDADTRFLSSNGVVTTSRDEWEFVFCPKKDKIYGERNGFRKLEVSGFVHHAHINGMYVEVVDANSISARFQKDCNDKATYISWENERWFIGATYISWENERCFTDALASKAGEDAREALVKQNAWTIHSNDEHGSISLKFVELEPGKGKCRQAKALKVVVEEAEVYNDKLKKKEFDPVLPVEVLAARLYTGPMYEKYNSQLRAASGDKVLRQKNDELLMGNSYVTTVHGISSCVLKLSKLMKLCDIFRGSSDASLPSSFLKKDDDGICGGVEYGFFSTTNERNQAVDYANGVASTVFEIKQGMLDRGADISWLSQYGHEKEILFPPLLGMQALSSRVSGRCLIIEVRLSLNLMSETLEQVLGKRSKMAKDMCDNILLEIDRTLNGESWQRTLNHFGAAKGDTKKAIREDAEQQLAKIKEYKAEHFNSDDTFLYEVQTAVQVGAAVRQQLSSLLERVSPESPGSAELLSPLARCRDLVQAFREVEVQEQEVVVTLTVTSSSHVPEEINHMWLPEVLGFIHRDKGRFEVSPSKKYTDAYGDPRDTTLGLQGEVPAGRILVAINGDRDLLKTFEKIQAAYKLKNEVKVVLTLGRRYLTEEAHQLFKDVLLKVKNEGDVEVGVWKLHHILDLNPELKELDLRAKGVDTTVDLKNKFGAKAGAALALVLRGRGASGLRKMVLDGNDFGACWKELVEALAAHRSLEELSLQRCQLSKEDVAAFADGLVQESKLHVEESKLHTVNLHGNHLCAFAGTALAQALRCGAASGLRKLTLGEIDQSGAENGALETAWMESGVRVANNLCLFEDSIQFDEDP